MLELLRDPAWQFVGVLLGLAAIAVSIWVYFAQKPKKGLLVENIVRIPLVRVGPSHIPGLNVTFQGRPVENASIALVKVTNIGNAPLPASDFEEPLALWFGAKSQVLHAEISSTSPFGIPILASASDREVLFSRNLLNPGDSYQCRVLVQNSSGAFKVKGRIAGVNEIQRVQRIRLWFPALVLVALVVLIGSMVFAPRPDGAHLFAIRAEEVPYIFASFLSTVGVATAAMFELKNRILRLREQMNILSGDKGAA